MKSNFGEYLIECIEAYIEEYPDEYVNPNLLMEIIPAVEVYTKAESDKVDKWASDMWGH